MPKETGSAVGDRRGIARDAAARQEWADAYTAYFEADPTDLGPEDLEAFADAAWWTSRLDESLDLRRRAFAAYQDALAPRRAGSCAWFLAYDYLMKNQWPDASGWLKRAQRCLADDPDCLETGFLALLESNVAEAQGDAKAALAHARRGLEIGRALNSPDLIAMATQTIGGALINTGNVGEGTGLLDEAMVAVVAGEISALYTGWIFCSALNQCIRIADLSRAIRWADAARDWCDQQAREMPYRGLCRLYRVEVTALRGAWDTAESEAARAAEELLAFEPVLAAGAHYALGEIRLRRGDLAGAEISFLRAHELGRDPQPGLALLRLAQGKTAAAAAALRVALAGGAGGLDRTRLLAAKVEVALEADDFGAAQSAVDELAAIAAVANSTVIDAMTALATGAVHLAQNDVDGAVYNARRALVLYQDLKLPYETAHGHTLLGEASRAAGDEERARLEFDAARGAFEKLDAERDARRVTALLTNAPAAGGLSAREAEVLRLVAQGKTNKQIAAELSLSEHTISRHLQNIFTKLGVNSRAAAAAFVFDHRLA
jgi:DNA-binding CsgD family transcriptional regulator